MPDFDADLAALEEKAPLTPEVGDDDFMSGDGTVTPPAQPQPAQAPPHEAQPAQATPAQQPAQAVAQPVPPAQGAAPALPQIQTLEQAYEELAKREKIANDQRGLAAAERAEKRAQRAAREAVEAQLGEAQRLIASMLAAQQQANQNLPDPETDTVAWAKEVQRRMVAAQQAQAQNQQAQQNLRQQNQYVTRLVDTVNDFETEFAAENPDYHEASDWLVANKQKEIEMMGVPAQVAEQEALRWAMQSANIIVNRGGNPAEVAYKLAKQFGFQPAPKPGATPTPAPAAGAQPFAMAAPAVAAVAPVAAAPAVNAGQVLQQIKDGQLAAVSMSGGGAPPGGPPTLNSIVNLEGAAFKSASEKWLSDMISGKARA